MFRIFTSTLLFLCCHANAALIIDVQEVGSQFIASYGGTLDLASTLGKEADRNNVDANFWSAGIGAIQFYAPGGDVDDYNIDLTSSPENFLLTANKFGKREGDSLLIDIAPANNWAQIWVPDGYVSGEIISGSMTFDVPIGMSEGIYEWTWANAGVADSLTLRVAPGIVPEPPVGTLLIIGLLALILARYTTRPTLLGDS